MVRSLSALMFPVRQLHPHYAAEWTQTYNIPILCNISGMTLCAPGTVYVIH